MNDTELPGGTGEAGVPVDPFGFFVDMASRISGLGGSNAPSDPSYVFHSPYLYCSGAVRFRLHFAGLQASYGRITLRVNAVSTVPGANAETILTLTRSLREIAYADGELAITMEAEPDTMYAVMGHIYGPTDASASTLHIWLDGADDGSEFASNLAAAKETVFGKAAAKGVARLVSAEPATLADPVSQMCTAAQFEEPAFDRWVAEMREPKSRHRKQWEFVYILQALERYGMLQPGARGLGFGVGEEPLPAILAAKGCFITATDLPQEDERAAEWSATGQHGRGLETMLRPDICAEDVFRQQVSFEPVDMNAIPSHLRGYDFCWSACAFEHLGSIDAGLRFVVESMRCLKAGGIAVHTTELNLSSDDNTVDHNSTVLFRRSDMERLTLELVSLGNQVAQLKYDQGSEELDAHVDMPPYNSDAHLKLALGSFVTTSFGIIVRKGAAIDLGSG